MTIEVKQVQVKPGELVERLNYLEYVTDNTVKLVNPFKNGLLRKQTEEFLELMRVFKDAVGTYRDAVADQEDRE